MRDIEIIDIDGIDHKDYPDYVDAYIAEANWKDTGIPLTEAELDDLNENHPDIAQSMAYEWSL